MVAPGQSNWNIQPMKDQIVDRCIYLKTIKRNYSTKYVIFNINWIIKNVYKFIFYKLYLPWSVRSRLDIERIWMDLLPICENFVEYFCLFNLISPWL